MRTHSHRIHHNAILAGHTHPRRSSAALALAVLATTLVTGPSAAATWRVRADGTGSFPTIQAALDGAAANDLILVEDGTYPEAALNFHGKALILRAENGPAACIIAKPFAASCVFVIASGEGTGTVIDGFTISAGNGTTGGGISISDASPVIVNNVITGNNADTGAGIHVSGAASSPLIVNNLIEDNVAYDEGGGVYNAYGTVYMRNTTVAFNRAPVASGMRFQGGTVDIAACIFWGNFYGTQLSGAINGNFSYNLVYGWVGPGTSFDGDADFATGPLGRYYLGAGSDAIDAGGIAADAACYTAGAVTVCMDERTTHPTLPYFDTGMLDVGYHYVRVPDELDVPGAYPSIRAAVAGAIDGDTIRLAAGTWAGPDNVDIVIDGIGVMVRGPEPGKGEAVIDCQGSSSSAHRAFRITNIHSGVEISDLTITGGYATYGGGILLSNASATIRRCIFDSNQATDSACLHVPFDSRAVVEDCVFQANEASDAGGVAAVGTDQFVMRRCVVRDNYAYWAAGGIYFNNGGGVIEDCLFVRNTSAHWGGALHVNNSYSEPWFRDCTFDRNGAPQGAHIYGRNGGMAWFERSLMTGGQAGGATYCTTGASFDLSCCDVWGNSGGDYTGCLAGQLGVAGNISANPLYCDAPAGNYELQGHSPCVALCGTMGWAGVGCALVDVPDGTPASVAALRLFPNVPNPFNPSTTIAFELPQAGAATLAIHDLAGRRVRTLVSGVQPAGPQSVSWDGRDDAGALLASGVYLCRLQSGGAERTLRVMLLK